MKITDIQTAGLAAAAARPDGAILPLPAHIRGGAIGKVCDALVAKELAINVGLPGKQTLVISNCHSACKLDPLIGVIGVQN